MRCAWLSVGAAWLLAGCTRPLNLGSDMVWSADFEHGGLSELSVGPGGGGAYVADAGPSDAAYALSTEQHHSGRYSVKFTSIAANQPTSRYPTGGGGIFKEAAFPTEAYYSAWYYIPQKYQTLSDWAILKFMVPPQGALLPDGALASPDDTASVDDSGSSADDASTDSAVDDGSVGSAADGGDDGGAPAGRNGEQLTLALRYVPPNLTLILSDPRLMYHEAPLPDPVPAVPVGRWFQIECLYRNASDAGGGGEIAVWLDGREIYDSARPFGYNTAVYFSPCSLVDDLSPSLAELYIDDVAVSYSRVSPSGLLRVP